MQTAEINATMVKNNDKAKSRKNLWLALFLFAVATLFFTASVLNLMNGAGG